MKRYPYEFALDGQKYYVYAISKDMAIVKYLREKCLKELPARVIIARLQD